MRNCVVTADDRFDGLSVLASTTVEWDPIDRTSVADDDWDGFGQDGIPE